MDDTSSENNIIISFLNKCGIQCKSLVDLNNLTIEREILLNEEIYKLVLNDIEKLKTKFSSSYMTSLQKSASSNQRWPFLNLVRQILKSLGYNLTPKRLCDGYTKEGKKRYKRMFIITKNDENTNK